MMHSSSPRRALPSHFWSWRWLLVAGVIFLLQLWMLYSPASSSSVGSVSATLDALLRPLPGPSSPSEPGFDKIVHLSSFALVCAALLAARLPAVWAVGLNVLHAGVSELVQWLWIPGRSGDWRDFLADCFGVLIAWLVFAVFFSTGRLDDNE
ncbi:MAG: VanZ family protein [Actinomycetaceae bacterium]|nr:VanZ family protein [Actinomycetaceae bacterium]